MRYDRQRLLPEIGEEGQQKLKSARVLIVGMGGLGSPIALYLAGAGVGMLGIMDGDVVSESNLQRQVLYTERDLGLPKVQCASERLSAMNSDICVRSYPEMLTENNAKSIFSSYDIVVDACDNFPTRYLIDTVCAELSLPYVYGAIRAFEGQVSVFTYGDSPFSYHKLFPKEENMPRFQAEKGVIGVVPGVVGVVQASEVLKLICGFGELLVGKLWTIDLRTMQSYILFLDR